MFDNNNDGSWRSVLNRMFQETQEGKQVLKSKRSTPAAILETMRGMGNHTSHRLDNIVAEVQKWDTHATPESVLDGLRSLYKDGKVNYREVAGRQFFIIT